MNTKSHAIKQAVQRLLSNTFAQHSLLWVTYILLLSVVQYKTLTAYSFGFFLTNELIKSVFYAAGVYYNIFYLIPNYLSNKRFLTYCALLVLVVIIITPLEVFLLYLKAATYPEYQTGLIKNQSWSFILTFLVISISTVFKIISDWVKHQLERTKLQTESMQSELRFLRSQINPHFLFNTLNNLYALTLKKSDEAPEIVLKLSEMMRYMLYECNERQVFLSQEVNYIRNYLDLERLRQGKNMDVTFEVSGEIDEQKIAPFMFIPFLENSFKHGLGNHLGEGFIHIRLDIAPETVHLFIENSKPEIPMRPQDKKSGGIGLVNVKRRLNLLYPEQYDLYIENEPAVYRVNMTLTL